jgi:hypothetical protein
MREYTVQAGDSPARIATHFAGCPKCACDLVAANPQKKSRVYSNGYKTFETLAVGEKLALPDKWFNGALDKLPRLYFESLPPPPVGVGRPPPGRRTPGPMGLGATVGGSLSHCDQFSMNVTVSDPNTDPSVFFPSASYNVSISPQLQDGSYQINGSYTGPAGWSWQDGTDWQNGSTTMTVNAFSVSGKSTVGACGSGGGQLHPGGGGLPGGVPGGAGNIKTCPAGQVPDVTTGACAQPCPDGSAPSNGGCGGSKGGTTPFQYVTGHRIQAVGSPTAGGKLPASVAASTVASIQATYDAASPGQYKVVSVNVQGGFQTTKPSIAIVLDYCGATQSVLDPSTALSSEGVAMEYSHTDLGPSPAGTSCKPTTSVTPPSTSGTTVAVGLGAAALAATALYFVLK